MTRHALASAILAAVALVVTPYAAPGWTREVGLDFWNAGHERAGLRTAAEAGRDWDARMAAGRHCTQALDKIVNDLCAGRATTAEAVDAVLAVARLAPDWFAETADQYRLGRFVGPNATDRDVAAHCLRRWIGATRYAAERTGETSHAPALAARLAEIDDELRSLTAPDGAERVARR